MRMLKRRIEKLEQIAPVSSDKGGGGWPLLVELYDDDEEAAISRAVAQAEEQGRPVNMGIIPPNGIRYIVVDLRSLKNKDNGGDE